MFFFLLILYAIVETSLHQELICNQDTLFACPCSKCWMRNYPLPSGDIWLTVNFERCSNLSRLNEREIRVNLANWMNEECAFVLRCPHIANTWDSSNILIGDFHCDAQENVLRLLVLKEPFSGYKSSNVVHWTILHSIIESREHLLSNILYSDLSGISITPKPEADILESEPPSRIPQWVPYAIASFMISFLSTLLIFCLIVTICLNWRLNWRNLVAGSWISTPKINRKSSKETSSKEEQYQMIELRSR